MKEPRTSFQGTFLVEPFYKNFSFVIWDKLVNNVPTSTIYQVQPLKLH